MLVITRSHPLINEYSLYRVPYNPGTIAEEVVLEGEIKRWPSKIEGKERKLPNSRLGLIVVWSLVNS